MKKIPVVILGATGSVGQKFVELLHEHPWFEIVALTASERSAGKTYGEAVRWMGDMALPPDIAAMTISPTRPDVPGRVAFSGLDAAVAGEAETAFARVGFAVVSNAKNHRMETDVPLLVPEINAGHLELVKKQAFGKGCIVTNPNCSTVGLVMALKPLQDAFGLQAVQVVTMQALSGAGYPGVPSMDIVDNVLPFISGEEEKMQSEPLKILGTFKNGAVENETIAISAQCNRVAVRNAHLESVSVKLKNKAPAAELIRAWQSFTAGSDVRNLPSAPEKPVVYFEAPDAPQPQRQRMLGKGMTVSIGRLKACPVLDYRFVLLVHNTIRGAAGGAILNAELLYRRGFLDD